MVPNCRNFCGGNFQDWLEVNLIEACNGKCSWCVEKNGFHPKEHADWRTIVGKIIESRKKNIILLGGEPTLYNNIGDVIGALYALGKDVYVTTNGSRLNGVFNENNLRGIKGINISIHHYNQIMNEQITGILLNDVDIMVDELHSIGAEVRFNCNCIRGYVDTPLEIGVYVDWAKKMGVDKIRFAELKFDDEHFIDLAKILDYKYGLNDNPFKDGCNTDAVINGVRVNFRQMCGLNTSRRARPEAENVKMKRVLYYDGKFYDGWQTKKQEDEMKTKELKRILEDIEDGDISVEEALEKIIESEKEKTKTCIESSPCAY